MPYYNTCPVCGAHLDPGEKCDCRLDEETLNSDELRELGLHKLQELTGRINF